jgi:hypothetical protein
MTFLMWRRTRKEELSRLRSLFQQLDYLKRLSRDQFNYIKNKGITSWTLPNIDLNFYLTHINHKIRGESACRQIQTCNLKKSLMEVHGKINNINNMFVLIYETHVLNTKKSHKKLEEYKKELTKENHYYTDLGKMIETAKREIKKIIKKSLNI